MNCSIFTKPPDIQTESSGDAGGDEVAHALVEVRVQQRPDLRWDINMKLNCLGENET